MGVPRSWDENDPLLLYINSASSFFLSKVLYLLMQFLVCCFFLISVSFFFVEAFLEGLGVDVMLLFGSFCELRFVLNCWSFLLVDRLVDSLEATPPKVTLPVLTPLCTRVLFDVCPWFLILPRSDNELVLLATFLLVFFVDWGATFLALVVFFASASSTEWKSELFGFGPFLLLT